MATTVRVRDEDKAALDALQARMTLATGRRIPLDQLIGRLIDLATDHADELVREDRMPRLSRQQKVAFNTGISDWGLRTAEEDIDQVLYGDGDAGD